MISRIRSACENKGEGFECSNNPGSYECICKDGYELIDDKCENIDECLPSTWRSGTETCLPTCEHILGPCPEVCKGGFCCKKDHDSCPPAAREVLTTPYSQCAVPVDYYDPCLSKPHTTCRDTDGSFECECDSGYERNEVEDECLDIDECEQNSHACPENSECSNFYGQSYFVKLFFKI